MSLINCLTKANLDEEEITILDTHIQSFRDAGKSKKGAEQLAVTARLEEINQDMQDVQIAIDKAVAKDVEKVVSTSEIAQRGKQQEAEYQRIASWWESATEGERLDAVKVGKWITATGKISKVGRNIAAKGWDAQTPAAKRVLKNHYSELAKPAIKADSTVYEVSPKTRDDIHDPTPSAWNARPTTPIQTEFFFKEGTNQQQAKEKAEVTFGSRVKEVQVGTFNIGLDRVNTDEQAAHVFAPLRKSNVEQFFVLTLDKDKRPISILKQGYGTINAASVYPKDTLGAIHSTPGARYVWIGHNHPSGDPASSEADHMITNKIHELIDGTGVDFMGSIIIAPGGESSTILLEGGDRKIKPTPKPRKKEIPLTEGRLRKIGRLSEKAFTGPADSIRRLPVLSKGDHGILFLDTRNRPTAYYPVSEKDLKKLRTGEVGAGASKLFQVIRQSNAASMLGYFPDATLRSGGVKNLASFASQADIDLLDVMDSGGSQAEQGGPLKHDGKFYSLGKTNKIFYSALTKAVEDIKQPSAPIAQWKAIINKLGQKGIKQEEIEWSGVNEWLSDQTGKVTKEQVIDYLSANEVQVQEVEKGRKFTLNEADSERMNYLLNKPGGEWDGTGYSEGKPLTKTEQRELDKLKTKHDKTVEDSSQTKFADYQLPGGQNYRELLLKLPDPSWMYPGRKDAPTQAAEDKVYRGGHYDESNILAHVRFNERTDDDGKKVLFIEEIQSDWHQKGRKGGYAKKPTYSINKSDKKEGKYTGIVTLANGKEFDRFSSADFNEVKKWAKSVVSVKVLKGVPDAPFKTTWPLLAMKRMIRYASENGFDSISWTTGEQQADRYDLSKKIESIQWAYYADDEIDIYMKPLEMGAEHEKVGRYTLTKLDDVIGKELAKKIEKERAAGEVNGEYSGLDLKVGGEGMVTFYDKMLPAAVNKYVKKWGSKVGETEIPADTAYDKTTRAVTGKDVQSETTTVHSLDITPEMKKSALSGQPLFALGEHTEAYKQKRKAVAKGVTKIVNEMAPGVNVEVVGQIFAGGQSVMLSGAKTSELQEVAGFYDPIRNIIQISLKASSELGGPDSIVQHESLHALKDAGLLTGREWRMLSNVANKQWKQDYGVPDTEEAIAYAFGDYRSGKSFTKPIDSLFKRIKTFFERLGNLLRGMGFKTVDDVFESIKSGEVGQRQRVTTPSGITKASLGRRTPRKTVSDIDKMAPGAADKVKKWVRRNFTKEGLLNSEAFERSLEKDSEMNVGESDISAMVYDFEQNVAKAFGVKQYNQVSASDLELVNRYLRGEEIDLPGNVNESIDHMRGYLDRLSSGMLIAIRDMLVIEKERLSTKDSEALQAYVRNEPDGYVPKTMEKHWNLYQTIEKNKGVYLTRSYQAFDDAGWKEKAWKNKDLINRAKVFIKTNNPDFDDLEIIGAVKGILQSAKKNGNFMSFIAKGTKLGTKDVSILNKRKDVPSIIRELLGEYHDPKVNFVRSATKMQYYLANHHFLMNLRNDGLGVFLFERETGEFHDEIAGESSEVMNPINGLYTTEDFRQGLEDATNKFEGSDLMRNIIRINSMVKYGKTILSPTTQARNFMSAAMFSVMNGHFNMSHAVKSYKVAKADLFTKDEQWRSYIKKLIGFGVIHNNPFSGELRDAIKDFTELDVYSKGPYQNLKKFLSFMQRAYQVGDDFWKIIGWENELSLQKKSGLSTAEAEKKAAYRIRNGYPTYSMVPRAVKQIRRWPLIGTFVSFPYEIVRTSYNQLKFIKDDIKTNKAGAARRILGLSIASSAAYAASVASMLAMGLDSDDDEAIREQLPPWSRNSQLYYVGYDDNGMPVYLDLSYIDPYTYIKKPLTAIISGNNEGIDKKIGDALSELLEPFIGADIAAAALGEIVFNKKLNNGGRIYNPNDLGPAKATSIMNHIRKAVQPGAVSNMERTIKAISGHTTRSGKQYSVKDEGLAWIGFRFGTLNIPQSLIYKAYGFQDDKRNATRILSYVAGSSGDVSDSKLKTATESMLKARKSAYKKMIKLVAGAKKLGVPDRQIRQSLKAAGVGIKDVSSIVRGKVPRLMLSGDFIRSAKRRAKVTAVNDERREKIKVDMKARRRTIRELIKQTNQKDTE